MKDIEKHILPARYFSPSYKHILLMEGAFNVYFIENMSFCRVIFIVIDYSEPFKAFQHLLSFDEFTKRLHKRFSLSLPLNSFLFHVDDFVFLDFKNKGDYFKGLKEVSFKILR
jgi:hypothetical protein